MVLEYSILILAAGFNKRLLDTRPKCLIPISGKPMIHYLLDTIQQLSHKPTWIYICINSIHGPQFVQSIQVAYPQLTNRIRWVDIGKIPYGTGYTLHCAVALYEIREHLLILYGDVPMVSPATLDNMLTKFEFVGLATQGRVIRGFSSGKPIYQEVVSNPTHIEIPKRVYILTATLDNPTGYGRILTDERGQLSDIIEERDATPEQRSIKRINTGIYMLHKDVVIQDVQTIHNNNTVKEFYINSLFSNIIKSGQAGIITLCDVPPQKRVETFGINDSQQLMDMEYWVKTKQLPPIPSITVASKQPSIEPPKRKPDPKKKTGIYTMRDIESYREEYPSVKPNPTGEKKTGIHRLFP